MCLFLFPSYIQTCFPPPSSSSSANFSFYLFILSSCDAPLMLVTPAPPLSLSFSQSIFSCEVSPTHFPCSQQFYLSLSLRSPLRGCILVVKCVPLNPLTLHLLSAFFSSLSFLHSRLYNLSYFLMAFLSIAFVFPFHYSILIVVFHTSLTSLFFYPPPLLSFFYTCGGIISLTSCWLFFFS